MVVILVVIIFDAVEDKYGAEGEEETFVEDLCQIDVTEISVTAWKRKEKVSRLSRRLVIAIFLKEVTNL